MKNDEFEQVKAVVLRALPSLEDRQRAALRRAIAGPTPNPLLQYVRELERDTLQVWTVERPSGRAWDVMLRLDGGYTGLAREPAEVGEFEVGELSRALTASGLSLPVRYAGHVGTVFATRAGRYHPDHGAVPR